MNIVNPKAAFHKLHKPYADQLSLEAQGGWLPTAIIYVLSDMARSGVSEEQLKGANDFVRRLVNYGEPDIKPGEMPDKSELKTYA